MSLNTVHLQGNISQDPDLRYLDSGTAVCNFSVAINRVWKDGDGEKKEEVSFIPCVAWGKTAELISQYFKTGHEILIEGRLKQDTWEDKETEKKRSAIKVMVEGIHFTRGGTGEKKKGDRNDRKRKDDDDDRPKRKSKIDDSDVPDRRSRDKKAKAKQQEDDDDLDVPF